MEYWKVGMLCLVEWDLILEEWHGSVHNIRPSSAFDSQYSNVPILHYTSRSLSKTPPLRGEIKAGPSGHGFFTNCHTRGSEHIVASATFFWIPAPRSSREYDLGRYDGLYQNELAACWSKYPTLKGLALVHPIGNQENVDLTGNILIFRYQVSAEESDTSDKSLP